MVLPEFHASHRWQHWEYPVPSTRHRNESPHKLDLLVTISNSLGLIVVAYFSLPSPCRGARCILLAGEASLIEAFRLEAMVE